MAGQVRLSGGRFRGRRLAVARGVRPTEGRVREALFSIWQEVLPGARLLDLFAGSGAVALEALGRGASEVDSVEGEPRVARQLKENLGAVSAAGWRVLRGRLPGALDRLAGGPYDLVFADPPYDFGDYEKVLRRLAPHLTESAQVVVEHAVRVDLGELEVAPLELMDHRVYGDTALSFFALRAVEREDYRPR